MLYEKVEKLDNNKFGLKEIKETENPFLKGPCLLNIAATKDFLRQVNGIAKEGMKMARYRVSGQRNAGFSLNDSQISFLSVSNMNDKVFQEFLNTYMNPLISNKGIRLDTLQAKKNMRNVNIMSLCNGTNDAKRIETLLIEKMSKIRL